ncbi:ATP-binding cassette domain-containing protein [Helicobacter sp. 23-1044]
MAHTSTQQNTTQQNTSTQKHTNTQQSTAQNTKNTNTAQSTAQQNTKHTSTTHKSTKKISDFAKIRHLTTRRDKFILLALLPATFLLSLIETIAISVIMPFISLASNPQLIFENKYANYAYKILRFEDTTDFMVAFSAVLVGFYIFRAGYNLIYSYSLNRFAFRKYHFFAYRLFCKAVELSYIDFTNRNTDILRRNILNESLKVSQFIQQILYIASEAITIALMYALLLFISWKMTLVLTLFLLANVALIIKTISKNIQKQGEINVKTNQNVLSIITKALGNFKIIKLKGIQEQVLNNFDLASKERVDAEIKYQVLLPLPRFILESLGFCILVAAVAYILLKYNSAEAVIPIISMYALALYRILPAVNRILAAYNFMQWCKKGLEIVYEDLIYHTEYEDSKPIAFEREIALKNISFEYKANQQIIKDFNLTIKKGDKIAFIGKSGAGKSTLIDLIIGIYKPKGGEILIDGVKLCNENLRSWRKKIGYIPQSIFLFDGSVAENIALSENIDESRVIECCKKANIWDFLSENEGINTRVGDGGIKLSGGQKQRIAIARALYDDPEILVLDEATSALDNETEGKIMDEIYSVARGKTLLVIAHRLSTIEKCQRVVELNKTNSGGGDCE